MTTPEAPVGARLRRARALGRFLPSERLRATRVRLALLRAWRPWSDLGIAAAIGPAAGPPEHAATEPGPARAADRCDHRDSAASRSSRATFRAAADPAGHHRRVVRTGRARRYPKLRTARRAALSAWCLHGDLGRRHEHPGASSFSEDIGRSVLSGLARGIQRGRGRGRPARGSCRARESRTDGPFRDLPDSLSAASALFGMRPLLDRRRGRERGPRHGLRRRPTRSRNGQTPRSSRSG